MTRTSAPAALSLGWRTAGRTSLTSSSPMAARAARTRIRRTPSWSPSGPDGDYLLASTPTLDRKVGALRKHKSQVSKPGREWDFEKFMRKRHRDVGKKGGYQYAESFKRITV